MSFVRLPSGGQISDEEAVTLCKLLGPDDFYGLAWCVIHSIESTPDWPIPEAIESATDSWQETLKQRIKNSNTLHGLPSEDTNFYKSQANRISSER